MTQDDRVTAVDTPDGPRWLVTFDLKDPSSHMLCLTEADAYLELAEWEAERATLNGETCE